MGITVRWDDVEQTILYNAYADQWTEYDFRMAVNEAVQLLNSVDHPVDGIYDFRETRQLLANVFGLSRYAFRRMPQRGGLLIYITNPHFAHVFTCFQAALDGDLAQRVFVVGTPEEARALIAHRRHRQRHHAGEQLPSGW